MPSINGVRLRVISINDVYSLENLPRLKGLAQHRLDTDPADLTLFVIAGDFVAPTILSALDAGRGMIDCLNAIGITHASLGNHENDIPAAELHRRVGELRTTWLSTNVQFDAAEFMPGLPADSLGRRVVLLANWYEFGEGHFLLPSTLAGSGYLDALRKVFAGGDAHDDARPTESQRHRFNTLFPRE